MNIKFRRIGIIGGGQLGAMLVEAAHKLGFEVAVLEQNIDCPAYLVLDLTKDKFIQGALWDYNKLLELSKDCEVLTFEIEHIITKVLDTLQNETGINILPSSITLEIINDKFIQKTFLRDAGFPVGDFEQIVDFNNIELLFNQFGLPFLLKSRKGGYDGGGNFVVKTKQDLENLVQTLDLHNQGHKYFVERFVDFEREISVLLARSDSGEVKVYPVIDTFQDNSVCTKTIVPSTLNLQSQQQAEQIAVNIANRLDYVGVMAVEMFVLNNGGVLVNEIAPRVHNSGHWTMNSSSTSQFEQHIRCITAMELGSIENEYPCTLMYNVFGHNYDLIQKLQDLKSPNVSVYDYGKKAIRSNRKMGHINIVGDSIAEVEQILASLIG